MGLTILGHLGSGGRTWSALRDMLPVTGTLSLDHLNENRAALEIELNDADFQALR